MMLRWLLLLAPALLIGAGCADNERCINHGCVRDGDGTRGGFGDVCVDDGECDAPLVCGPFTGTCAETCTVADDCVTCAGVHGACTCNGAGFCGP